MSHIEFNDDTSRRLEKAYGARDVVRRRGLARAALDAQPGDRVLDVGCGPGFYLTELLGEVGASGSVVGVDSSADMLAMARQRCDGHGAFALHEGTATALPVADGEFDGVISVQVLEYVKDATGALVEMRRALRPGGRVVVWDSDWGAVAWHSADAARMDRVLNAWADHLVHRSLSRTLAARLHAAGFENIRLDAHAFASIELTPDTFAGAMLPLVENFVPGHQGVSADETAAWSAEQRDLAARGEFYFAITQSCFSATKPLYQNGLAIDLTR